MNELLVYSLILLSSTFLASISQVLLKKSSQKQHGGLLKEYLNPQVIGAYALFFFCTLLTLYSLKVVPLGLGAILETTGYIYITVFGVLIFKEKITRMKILGMVLLVCGIIVYALCG